MSDRNLSEMEGERERRGGGLPHPCRGDRWPCSLLELESLLKVYKFCDHSINNSPGGPNSTRTGESHLALPHIFSSQGIAKSIALKSIA